MEEPTYHLAGVMHTRDELPADFDGPLSVILLLLSKNKIEIQDVSITSILEQYLAYLDEMKRLDMEIASEFIAMASHLMLIKTKMLLSAAEREEAMSEMELLIRSLEEKQRAEAYEQIRTAVAFLEPRSDIGNGFFPHAPQPLRPDATYRYRHEPQDLLRAMAAMAERSERRLPPKLSNFQGIVSRDKKGRTGPQAAADARRGEIPRAVPRQPLAQRDRCDVPRRTGALPRAFRQAGGRRRRSEHPLLQNAGGKGRTWNRRSWNG